MNRENPIFRYLLLLIIDCMILLAFVSCRTPQLPTLPNASEKTNDSIRTELRIDTIYQDRWHKEYAKGDTVYIHDSIDRWRVREVYIHDSINNSRIDTIYKAVQVEKPYKQFLVNSGIALWIIIILIVLAIVAGLFIKFAK